MTIAEAIGVKKQKLFWSLLLLLNGCLLLWFISYYFYERGRMQQEADALRQTVGRLHEERIVGSADALRRLAVPVQKANGDLEKVRELIDDAFIRKGGALRIAWSDKNGILQVGTFVSTLQDKADLPSKPVSLRHRDYIRYVMRQPGKIYISHVTLHAITGRPFFAVALGVTDQEGHYLGCLASIVDIADLQALLDQALQQSRFQLQLTSPHGETLYDNVTEGASLFDMTSAGKFQIQLFKSDATMFSAFTLRWLLVVAGVNTVFLLSAWLMRRFFIHPLQELSRQLLELPAHYHSLPDMPEKEQDLLLKAQQVRGLLVEYFHTKEQADDYRRNLQQAMQLIQHLHEEQTGFLNSISVELEDVFTAISHYTALVERNMEESKIDAVGGYEDAVYIAFEDVKEAALNLKFLANSFYLICAYKIGKQRPLPERIDPVINLHELEDILTLSLETRSLSLNCRHKGPASFCYDAAFFRHLVWSLLYFTIRHAGEDQTITVESAIDKHGFSLTLQAEYCLPELIPEKDAVMEEFFPSKRTERKQLLQQTLLAHANSIVAHYLVRAGGGSLRLEAIDRGKSRFGLELALTLPEMAGC